MDKPILLQKVVTNRRQDEGHYLCRCGNTFITRRHYVDTGHTKSCGCYNATAASENNRKHGKWRTKTHRVWTCMKTRCNNPNDANYKNYGAKGIKVCSRWEKFENFLADMGERPDGMSLDRINNKGDYSPDNCRWATREEQDNNTSRSRKVTIKGKTLTIAQWAKETGLPYGTVYSRYASGKRGEELLTARKKKGEA